MVAALATPHTPQRKRRPVKLPTPCERTVQRNIVAGLRALGLAVVKIGNGGQLTGTPEERMRKAIARRRDGEVSGFPDLLILSKRGPSRFGLLEIKREGASMTTDHVKRQLECHEVLRAHGHNVGVADTLDQAVEHVRAWGLI